MDVILIERAGARQVDPQNLQRGDVADHDGSLACDLSNTSDGVELGGLQLTISETGLIHMDERMGDVRRSIVRQGNVDAGSCVYYK